MLYVKNIRTHRTTQILDRTAINRWERSTCRALRTSPCRVDRVMMECWNTLQQCEMPSHYSRKCLLSLNFQNHCGRVAKKWSTKLNCLMKIIIFFVIGAALSCCSLRKRNINSHQIGQVAKWCTFVHQRTESSAISPTCCHIVDAHVDISFDHSSTPELESCRSSFFTHLTSFFFILLYFIASHLTYSQKQRFFAWQTEFYKEFLLYSLRSALFVIHGWIHYSCLMFLFTCFLSLCLSTMIY